MNEKLKTYILDNMDEGTIIDFPNPEDVEERKLKREIKELGKLPKAYGICQKVNFNMAPSVQREQEERKGKKRLDEDFELGGKFDLKEESCETFIEGMSLDDYINGHLPECNAFQTLLFNMIDERGLKDPDVYNKVGMSRKTFSKIRSSKDYHPSRETVIMLGLSLELSISEMEELLESAAYSLPRNNAQDLIIRFACESKIYNLMDVNEMLDEYNCKLLGE